MTTARPEFVAAREGTRGLHGKTVRQARVRPNGFGLPASVEIEFDDGDIVIIANPPDMGRYLVVERDERAQS